MALVRRMNVTLEIEDDLIDSYLDKGYNVIDDTGKVIVEAIPNDLGQLRMLVIKYRQEIKELKEKLGAVENEPVKETKRRSRKHTVEE